MMLSEKPRDVDFLHSFFFNLKKMGVRYCILRNADEVEAGDAHDVDMTVDSSRLEEVNALLHAIAGNLGWKLHMQTGRVQDRYNIKCYHFWYEDAELRQISIVHIDVFPTFSWNGYELLSNDTLLKNVPLGDSLYVSAAPEVEAVCNLFVRLLFNGYVKEKYKAGILKVFQEKKAQVMELLSSFLSSDWAARIIDSVIVAQWAEIEKMRDVIVRCIRKHAARRKLAYWRYLADKICYRRGRIIALLGTDGSGKSTIVQGIPKVLERSFPEGAVVSYHWRPSILDFAPSKNADELKKIITDPHNQQPYGKFKSFLKMGYYALDYLLGYWGKIYWDAVRGKLVVFDRYYYDFYIDKIRYRLNVSDAMVRFFQLFVPSPDATFVLVGDARKIAERKREISVEATAEQIALLKRKTPYFAHPVEVDVTQDINGVLYDMCRGILRCFCSNRSR